MGTFTYIALNNPITFKEIFSLWVGAGSAEKVFSFNRSYVHSDDDLDSIRSVENQLVTAVYNGELKTYREREAAGRRLFFEVTVNLALPLAGAADGIDANLIFMFHTPECPSIPSEPVYFESAEVFQKFPFLKPLPLADAPGWFTETLTQMEAEYITAEDWRKKLGMSQPRFVTYLRVNREDLPLVHVFSDGKLFHYSRFSNDENEWFYDVNTGLDDVISMIATHEVAIHRNNISEHKRKTSAATLHPEQVVIHPTSTGSTRNIARIRATRQACEAVRVEIEQGQHGFQVKDEYKTNWAAFRAAVESVLGSKPHRDTAREEWEKVPKGLQHLGRVPEQ